MSKYINWWVSCNEKTYNSTKINHNKNTIIIWDFKWDQKRSLTTSLDTPQPQHQSMPNAGVYSIVNTITTLSHTQQTMNYVRRREFMEHKTQISYCIYFHSKRKLYYLNKQICLKMMMMMMLIIIIIIII